MFYTIYKITNQINGKFYIGSHKTSDLNDNYMGSGKYLKNAQKKYGIENFKKETLFVFDTPEEMYAKETEIVNEDFIAEENTYNVKVGGYGGFDYINDVERFKNPTHSKEHSNLMIEKLFEKYPNGTFIGKSHTEETKRKIGKAKLGNKAFLGRTHSDATKEKMRKSSHGKHDGKLNSQFGTMWITNGEVSKKINKLDPIPDGWYKGRIVGK